MVLLIGGAYQGKLTWAVEQFGLVPDTLCDLAQGFLHRRIERGVADLIADFLFDGGAARLAQRDGEAVAADGDDAGLDDRNVVQHDVHSPLQF